jgi:hypothetical protein
MLAAEVLFGLVETLPLVAQAAVERVELQMVVIKMLQAEQRIRGVEAEEFTFQRLTLIIYLAQVVQVS